jgi:RNA polymerase sigma-70 factor, ECF subfamily
MTVRRPCAGSAENEQQIQEVVICASRGDASAFALLYERYHDYVRNTAYHILHNHEDSEDVAQNVWRKLLPRLEKYPREVRFSTWLYRVVCNEAIDHTRRLRAYRRVHADAFAEGDDATAPRAQAPTSDLASDQELDLLQTRVREELARFLERVQIKHPLRALCFELHYLQGMSVDEIASETHLPGGTVKSHLYYARKFLGEEHPILFDLYLAVQERLGKSRR